MIIPIDQKVITHYGIRGMRWGIRNDKAAADARRAKADKVRKNLVKEGVASVGQQSDLKNANWASMNVGNKAAAAVATSIGVNVLANVMLKGSYPNFKDPKWALDIAKGALVNYGVHEVTSKNAMKRYTDEGKRDRSKKQYDFLTPEHGISLGIRSGVVLGSVAAGLGKQKLSSVMKGRYETEMRMKKWGSNIFDTKTSNMETIYDDGYMSILQQLKP